MILFQVHAPCIAIDPFEGDAPRAIDGDRVALGFPVQRVKPEARDTQVLKPLRLVQRVQDTQCSFLVIRTDAGTGSGLEQVTQALMAEALNHKGKCSVSIDTCKSSRDIVEYSDKLKIPHPIAIRREGHELREVVIQAGATRMRPILLTAFAIILGAAWQCHLRSRRQC